MQTIQISVEELYDRCADFCAGDRLLLSGTVYTARDAAHKRITELIENGLTLPFSFEKTAVYYAGPTATPPGMVIGSCGPTTSERMDGFTPLLMEKGLKVMIGKGKRSPEVEASIQEHTGIYLCALGGAGALAAKCIKKSEVIAFEELGCESVKRLLLEDFPLIVGTDCKGGSLFNPTL